MYEWRDDEFWDLANLLMNVGPPDGHDFDRYREQWIDFRTRLRGMNEQNADTNVWASHTELDWTVRGFVLYASEFWRRFKNEAWRNREFPTDLPFEKLTWLHFLSLIGWESLYQGQGKIAGYIPLRDGDWFVAHTSHNFASENAANSERRVLEKVRANRGRESIEGEFKKASYPGLYFPILAALNWWRVAPMRLPTSIRYLDTFAYQGGAVDRLVVEFELVSGSGPTLIYRATSPPSGYGLDVLTITRGSLPRDFVFQERLNVTMVFNSKVDDAFDDPGAV